MKEIICPNCQKAFKLDDAGYSEIQKQVRNEEFERDLEIRLKQAENEKKSAIELAEAKKDAELARLAAELEKLEKLEEANLEIALTKVRDELNSVIAKKDEEIASYKDYKARQSTKMIGESLEQHCENEFEKVRSMAFPRAYFAKDNDSKTGSKGDYIFRDSSEEGVEFLSIMFEMKNEADETATKKKNEDFFKELDKDRNEKGCEYAVLVSLLEKDNDLYNSGIVDVSHKYPKMYVVRPQFFLPLISLLRNASLGALEYKSELERIKEQNIDITTFERDLEDFKSAFDKNYGQASKKFHAAIDEIDKAINQLEKAKQDLLGSENNLRLANQKAADVTIKRLTRDNPTMTTMFRELEGGANEL